MSLGTSKTLFPQPARGFEMDTGHREYLKKRHTASEWQSRSTPNPQMIAGFSFSGSELSGWTLLRTRLDERRTPAAQHTLWQHGDLAVELLAIDAWECVSVVTAHD